MNHPPTAICPGHSDGDDGPRVLVADPESGRGFVYSTDQTGKGRPEFLFLDTLGDQFAMVSCSKIISDYDASNAVPQNLEVINKDPWGKGQTLTFVARVIVDEPNTNSHLKRELERLYLHKHAEHGIVVLIPNMKDQVGEWWGSGSSSVPAEHSNETLDHWISTLATEEADKVRSIHAMLAAAGRT